MTRLRSLLVAGVLAAAATSALSALQGSSVPYDGARSAAGTVVRLADGEEFSASVTTLRDIGEALFSANWTRQQGGDRPRTKGTGRPVAESSDPLTGLRGFNRVSAPDANSCAGCHNIPYGITGGSGDFVAGVFVLGQRFDFSTFDPADKLPTRGAVDESGKPATLQDAGNFRASTGMFGAGYLEMLARQMTEDLQRIRDSIRHGETKPLVAKGVHFGSLTLRADGVWDTSKVEGLGRVSLISSGVTHPPTLVVRPWHQASNVVSLREFVNTAFNHHHGIQTTERFGVGTDPDGDGVVNEMSRAEVTAVSVFQATLQVPGRVIPRHPAIERAVLRGEQAFEEIGCATCHVPRLPLDRQGWIFVEPNPFNMPGNMRTGEIPDLKVDLSSDLLPAPRLKPDASGTVWVEAYTDFKLHDLCTGPEEREPLDQNAAQWNTARLKDGNCRFLTKRLWGAANEPPFFHHGLFTTLRRSVLAHAGEGLASRQAFEKLPKYDQDSLIEFLKTLQVLPPGTPARIVDEQLQPREWPPAAASTARAKSSGDCARALAVAQPVENVRLTSGLRNLELLADSPNCPVLDFSMSRDAGNLAWRRTRPDAVASPLANQHAAVATRMAFHVRELHTSAISKLSRTACGDRSFFASSRWYCSTSLSASARFDFASSSVSPCEMTAGISSRKQLYPPSLTGSNTADNFMSPGHHQRRRS